MGIINKLKNNYTWQKKSFTLIEMIVVIATIGLVLPALFAIIFSILQQQVKIQRLSIVKREGDYILNIMENAIKNYATKIYSDSSLSNDNEKCKDENSSYSNDGQNFYFKDKLGNWFRFYLDTANSISSESSVLNNGSPGSVSLNSSQTKITNFSIQCYRTALYSPPVINISFTISYYTSSSRVEETASFNYQTKVKLKSY
jgi:type II secretory pathway pseudopilin PulG